VYRLEELGNASIIMLVMILVTGATGFVGQALVRHLVARRRPIRLLLRPGRKSLQLPKGVPIDAVVCDLGDERALAAALRGVTHIIHLIGAERESSRASFERVDVRATRALAEAAAKAGVRRLVYLSHLGADRASAFPLLKAKGIAEALVINSGVPYTILRSAVTYGPGDQFITGLTTLLRRTPGFFLMPGDGEMLLQPLWIGDLVEALDIALEYPPLENQVISIGGPEYLSLRQIVGQIMDTLHLKRWVINIPLGSLKILALILDQWRGFPMSIYWLDYLSSDRTTSLDSLPRVFGIIPARFHQQITFLTRSLNPSAGWLGTQEAL